VGGISGISHSAPAMCPHDGWANDVHELATRSMTCGSQLAWAHTSAIKGFRLNVSRCVVVGGCSLVTDRWAGWAGVGGLSRGTYRWAQFWDEIWIIWCLTLNKSIFKMYLNEQQTKTNLLEIDFRKKSKKESTDLEFVWGRKTVYKFYPKIKNKNLHLLWIGMNNCGFSF
jgi:hypothetical protein